MHVIHWHYFHLRVGHQSLKFPPEFLSLKFGLFSAGKTRTKDKYRVVYTDKQRLELEREFQSNRYITMRRKAELSMTLGLSERQVSGESPSDFLPIHSWTLRVFSALTPHSKNPKHSVTLTHVTKDLWWSFPAASIRVNVTGFLYYLNSV